LGFENLDALRLGEALQGNTCVHRLQIVMTDLKEVEDTVDSFGHLLQWIATSPSLIACDLINIEYNVDPSAPLLLNRFLLAMAVNTSLERSFLDSMNIYVDAFSKLLRTTTSLKKLQLKHCNCHGQAGQLVATALTLIWLPSHLVRNIWRFYRKVSSAVKV
jgi:hypothetical protein